MNDTPAPDSERKEATPYHVGAVTAFAYLLRKYIDNKDVVIIDEHQLSKQALEIDFVVIKKNRDVTIETNSGRIFRGHNIVEYKSPSAPPPSIHVFNKVISGYVGLYASQERIMLTDMTATIVCFKRPQKLFQKLETELNYKILREYPGIYYIIQEGFPADKALAIQIIVNSELQGELALSAFRPNIDVETAKRVIRELPAEDDENSSVSLASWWDIMFLMNPNLYEEAIMVGWDKFFKYAEEKGMTKEWTELGRQEGMRQGMQKVFALLKKGYSIEEAEKKLQLV